MLAVIGDLLTIGVAITISPLAIVAVILMATGGKGRTNGTAFVLGCYTFAILFVGALVTVGRAAGTEDAGSGSHLTVDIVDLTLGCGLLTLAVLEWRKRGATGTPKWMTKVDGLSLGTAFLAGILISGPLSPKDLPLLVAAGGRIAQATLPIEQIVIVILIFGAIGVTATAIPWLVSVISPSKAELRLSGIRTWLVTNNTVIMCILFVVLGVKLVGSGIAGLAS